MDDGNEVIGPTSRGGDDKEPPRLVEGGRVAQRRLQRHDERVDVLFRASRAVRGILVVLGILLAAGPAAAEAGHEHDEEGAAHASSHEHPAHADHAAHASPPGAPEPPVADAPPPRRPLPTASLVAPAASAPDPTPGTARIVLGATGVGAALGLGPTLLRALRRTWPVVGAFFTRLPRDRLLELDARRRVYDAVVADPGVGVEDCATRVGLARSTVSYHARMLERGGLVRSRREGRTLRLYPPDTTASTPSALRVPTACALAAVVREAPGIDQASLARRLDVGPSLVLHHARRLEAAGLLRVAREAGRVRYWPAT